jgi:DNA-nicking Smr family endonuclease
MADEPLDPEARALWQRVAETVRPLKGRVRKKPSPLKGKGLEEGETRTASASPGQARQSPPSSPSPKRERAKVPTPADTLDGTWDKKLRLGTVAPDFTIDLHGYTVAAAHAELEAGLTLAVGAHARLILLVAGRPPPPGRSRLDNPLRGVIRASIGDWLHHSRHAGRIAAVRNAHPRHGGAGALYVILRRVRE